MDNDLQVVEPVHENMAHHYIMTPGVDVDLDMQPSISRFDIVYYIILFCILNHMNDNVYIYTYIYIYIYTYLYHTVTHTGMLYMCCSNSLCLCLIRQFI